MALFKICRGAEGNLPTVMTDGYAYFCTDTGSFYIDYKNASGTLVRSKISAKYADKLRYIKDGTSAELVPEDILTVDNYTTKIGNASTSTVGLMSASDKSKLDGVAEGANKTIVDTALSNTSTNPVQNKIVKAALDNKLGTTATAASSTKLATARTINGVSFDGTSNITITANPTANQLEGGTLDNVRTPGYYFAGGSSGVANIPDGVDAFGVEVYRSAGGYITQELTSGNQLSGKKFMRTYNNSAWSDWDVIYTSAYPQIHVGPTEPTDPNVQVWINTAEEGTGVIPVLPRIATITLTASGWTGGSSPYSQAVTMPSVTTSTKLDLQPTVAQIVSLQNADIALMAENDGNGKVTVYSFGGKPSSDMTMQVLLTEVSFV